MNKKHACEYEETSPVVLEFKVVFVEIRIIEECTGDFL
jgi:hypothetical protein